MAIVRNNPMMEGTSGKLGVVYFRTVRGKLIVCNRPPKGRKFTAKQLESQHNFGQVSREAKALLKDTETKEKYQARIDNSKFTAHMVAQSELMESLKKKRPK